MLIDNLEQHFNTVQNASDAPQDHQAELSHEVIGGAAAYEAAKAYEEKCARDGQPASHAEAKEILAGLAGGIVDREFETKGLDWVDREEAKRSAAKAAEGALQQGDYGN